MKILYFDCSNGVSGDMLLKAVSSLSGAEEKIYAAMEREKLTDGGQDHDGQNHGGHGGDRHGEAHHGEHHHDHHGHGRSYGQVKALIEGSGFSNAAKKTALRIYGHIAEAEAKVHGATLETVHFHEVGRDEAVKNALAIGMALERIAPDMVLVSEIYDGHGTVVCSHGEISVPVPAVMALRERCNYTFMTADVDTEMVTPSGLAGLMGMGAVPVDGDHLPDDIRGADLLEKGRITGRVEAVGSRHTGRPGLFAYVLEI